MGVRLTGGLISLIATGVGDGVAIAAATLAAWTLSPGKRAIIRKIMWMNRTGGNCNLLVGYGDLTVAGSIYRVVMPSILMINGIEGSLDERDLPICGNGPEGFQADTTPVTGSLGTILVETDSLLVGAAPGDVQVQIEVEEF